jgi:transposase-like protein
MAQGREWNKEERENIIQSIKPYLEMGFSRNKACQFVGLAPQTLSNWVQEDDSLGILLTSYENVVNTTVMANLVDAIKKEAETDDSRKETSKWWAERRMKEDFSTKTEVDQKVEGQLGVIQLPQKNGS